MPPKTILFDFMGTCLDWHSSIVNALPSQIPSKERSDFAIQWRHAYFDANSARLARGEPPENIDITHRRVLEELLQQKPDIASLFTEEVKDNLIEAWHSQPAWEDVKPALLGLKEKGHEIFVHANGTTRLQLDLVKTSGLSGLFDLLISSEMLGVYKPARENYEKALAFLGRKAEDCVMVAAHAYDVRGAKAVGMKTVYVYRRTDDVNEDQEVVKGENDAWIEGMGKLAETIGQL